MTASGRTPVNRAASRRTPRYWRMAVLAAALGIAASAVLFELGCRLIWLRLEAGWTERQHRVTFFYQRSANPLLGYELSPGFELKGDRGHVRIGTDGLRVTEGAPSHPARAIALVGDSVVFGSGHRQGETPADYLQQGLNALGGDPPRVANFGVPGYSFSEIREFFEIKAARLKIDAAVLAVNLNDFARRDSVYEGGDNGLYRMFTAPPWRSAYFVRKAAYRFRRNALFDSEQEVSPEWYRWLWEANRDYGLAQIERMSSFARGRSIRFDVVLFPSGQAYRASGHYELEDIHGEIAGHLGRIGIRCVDGAGIFRDGHNRLIDATDHPTVEGNAKLAELIAGLIE